MKLINQSKQGIQIASSSFTLLWHHKQLLIYSAIPIVIQVFLELLVYNILVSPQGKAPITLAEFDLIALFIAQIPTWLHYVGLLSIIFISFFIMLFFNAALIHHIMHILQYSTSSLIESISAMKNKIPLLLAWTIISLIPLFILRITQNSLSTSTSWFYGALIIFGSIALSALWSLVTLFVVPIITLENKSIRAALIKSFAILNHYFILTISGEIFIGFLTVFAFLLSLLFGSIYPSVTFSYTKILVAGVTVFSIFIRCVLTTTHTIFKTIIYDIYDEYTTPEREFRFLP